jgi:hypothetical protein
MDNKSDTFLLQLLSMLILIIIAIELAGIFVKL